MLLLCNERGGGGDDGQQQEDQGGEEVVGGGGGVPPLPALRLQADWPLTLIPYLYLYCILRHTGSNF